MKIYLMTLLLAVSVLSGCGQKGPLFLPEEASVEHSPTEQAPADQQP